MASTDRKRTSGSLRIGLAAGALVTCAAGVIVLAVSGQAQVLRITLALCAAVALIELAAIIATHSPPHHR